MRRREGLQSAHGRIFVETEVDVKRDDFKRLLCGEAPSFEVEGNEGQRATVEPELTLVMSEDLSEQKLIADGFTVSFEDGKEKTFKSFDETEEYLKRIGAIKDGEIHVVSFGDGYKTLDEYEEAKAFEHIGMEGLLLKYGVTADSFSLSCPYGDGFDKDHPFGTVYIDEDAAKTALAELKRVQYETAKSQFELISDAEREELPPFDELYNDIGEEFAAYLKKHRKKAEKNDGNTFFCDEFARGRTKYTAPQELWHIYMAHDFIGACGFLLKKMGANTIMRPLDYELRQDINKALKDNLIRTEITFCTHCTVSSQLSKVFYFRLNEKTSEWLSRFSTDYDLEELQDLAFYGDGKILFSSCTHERFHCDCTTKTDKEIK